MELLITIAYFFLVRLIFFNWKLLKFNLFWKFVVFGLWCAAAMTEVIGLGQMTPYTKELFVQSYVVPMSPEWGGEITEVLVKPNEPVKKGDPLFRLDEQSWRNTLRKNEAILAQAETDVAELEQSLEQAKAAALQTEADLLVAENELKRFEEAAQNNAVSQLHLDESRRRVLSLKAQLKANRAGLRKAQVAYDSMSDGMHSVVAEAAAEVDTAKYYLQNRTVVAPADGYVVNLQLHPGAFYRLKQPVMTFVSTEEFWMVGKVIQRGAGHIRAGDQAEVAFAMYPGRVFPAEVVSVVYASGSAQGYVTGRLPVEQKIRPPMEYVVRLKLKEEDPDYPVRFGAGGMAAIYTKKSPEFLRLLRRLEIRGESFMSYVYNPF